MTTDMAATRTELAGDLLVVVPALLEPAYRIAGARTATATGPAEVTAIVDAELAARRPGVVAVHHDLFDAVPATVRQAWEQRLAPLVVALPVGTGPAGPGRRHALRALLGRAVGYEITFSPEGGST